MTIFDTRRFLQAKLKEANPEADVRSGSGIGTLLIKPFSAFVNPFQEELDFIKTQLSLADVSTLTTDNVDQLIANLFIDRRVGTLASGSVRIFFSSAQDSQVPEGTGFLDRNSRLYQATEDTSISQAEMSLNVDGSQFFFDVPIAASAEGSEFNVDANEIVSAETDIIGAVRITNPNPLTNGLPTETDDEYVERAQIAITVRNIINRRSISTVLLNEFNFLVSLQSIGFGEPEMIRDIIQVLTSLGEVDLNIGGHADIYIETNGTDATTVNIPTAAMVGELIISTNEDRGLVSESVKSGLFIDIAPGFFSDFEVEEQFGVPLDPTSTYHIYLDVAGVLQLDNVTGSFPSNSIPLSIVTTDAFTVTTVTDSRVNVVSFPRPMVAIDQVVELDPVTLNPTDRTLTDGRLQINDIVISTANGVEDCEMTISVNDNIFTVCTLGGDVFLSGFDANGIEILASQNISDPTDVVTSISRRPTISIDPLGKISVIFEDDRAGTFDVYHTRLDQAGAIEVAVASITGATAGVIDTTHDNDETGNLHIVYIEGTDLKYIKIDVDQAVLIAITTISSTTLAKVDPSIATNGNIVTASVTGRANGDTSFDDPTTTFPGSVTAGQTLVLTGGTLDFAAIMDGTETEPPAFAATLTGSVSGATLDTSIVSGTNVFETVVDGVTVNVVFTDSSTNPIATVISEINVASNATALAASIATNSGSDEIVLTSPTTGVPSTINITIANTGLGFLITDSDQGGIGYNTSIVNGTNTMELDVDGVNLDVVFTDAKGNPIATVITEINTVSLASSLAASIATDGGGFITLTSPTEGLTSIIEIVAGNTALGFVTAAREEGGTELGRRIGIVTVVGPTEITLADALRTISSSDDVEYRIEAVEAGMSWTEDSDIFFAKIDDVPAIFVSPTNITRIEVQASQLATPAVDALFNGPGANEITLDDTLGLFLTNSVVAGDTVRVITATPSSAEGDFLVKQVNSEIELILTGTLVATPANTVTYEIFKTVNSRTSRIGTNTDNETQMFWVDDNKRISMAELNRTSTTITLRRDLQSRPNLITFMDVFVDSSDASNVAWIETSLNSGDAFFMKVDEFGDIVLDPIIVDDSVNVGRFINIETNTENEPVILWVDTDFAANPSNPETTVRYSRFSAQDFFIKVNDAAINMSVKEDRSIIFTKEFLNQPIGVTYQTSAEVQTIEDFIQAPENQIIDSNYLTKHVLRAVVNTTITYSGTVDDAQQVVIDFINGVTDSTIEASDISDALYAAGATHVNLPFKLTVEFIDIDGTFVSISSNDEVTIPRVARFFADEDSVTVTEV